MEDLAQFCVNSDGIVKDAMSVIKRSHNRCAIVLNDDDKVVGVISEGDIIKLLTNGLTIYAPLSNVVQPSFKFITEYDLDAAKQLIRLYGISLVPVVSDEFRLIDIITVAHPNFINIALIIPDIHKKKN